jgi:hypothetical protein
MIPLSVDEYLGNNVMYSILALALGQAESIFKDWADLYFSHCIIYRATFRVGGCKDQNWDKTVGVEGIPY